MLFKIPVAVALLQCIGVGSSECHSSFKVSIMILASFEFRTSASSSASAVYDAPNLSIWNRVDIAPSRCIGCGFYPRNKCTSASLLEYISDH